MQVRTLVRHLWLPAAIVALFTVATIYENEIFVQLGLTTWKQLRTALPYVIQVGVWLSFAYLVTRVIDVTVWDQVGRRVPVPRLLRDVTKVIVYAMAVSGIAKVVFDQDIGRFWAASGLVGLVIGLALRNVIVDVFMGLAMNFDRPFEIGNYIQLATGPMGNGPSGKVVELNWRTTRILTAENNLVVIPNGKLGETTVINFSRPGETSEMEFIVTLDASVPAERALRVLTAGAMSVAGTSGVLEDPAPKCRIKGFTGVGVDYKIKYFIDPRIGGPGKARHAVMQAVLDQLHYAGLHLAVNKQEFITGREHARHQDPSSIADRATLLARTDLFRNLEPAAREHLAVRMRQHVVRAGDAVVHANDAGDSMFVIFEGLLHAQVPSHDRQSIVRVGKLGAGSFFGEISALTGEPRTATVTAAADSLIFEIQKDAFASLLEAHPEVLQILGEAIAARRSRTAAVLAEADAAQIAAEERTFTRLIIDKMKSFFRIGPSHTETVSTRLAPVYTPH
ncbi:MAG TPA: mechanosensitive ion channel family protein [Gemmatimonadaceae bacterium]|nr:mechanosensitive ion channel family protein [Gemmatimonadaceae bacterium]